MLMHVKQFQAVPNEHDCYNKCRVAIGRPYPFSLPFHVAYKMYNTFCL
jgi:hypothetical protein